MGWKVVVFETSQGNKQVEEFITSLQPATIAKVSYGIGTAFFSD